jgi:carbonic anhydrase
MLKNPTTSQPTRRSALKLMAAGVAGIATLPALAGTVHASPIESHQPANGEQALDLLLKGNQRYLSQALTSCSMNMAELRKHSEAHQDPFAAVLSCADSRVPAELVFDQTLGQLFVVRVAGNIATPDTIASLEYAGAAVGVKLILVIGHTNCGAIKAASENKPVPGQVSSLFQYMHPAVAGQPDLTEASRKNALQQAATLRDASPVLAELVESKKLLIKAALYDVGSGIVTILEA